MARKDDNGRLVDRAIGARLRQLREHLGWSEETVAALMRRNVRTIRQYESGERHVTAALLMRFARLFQVPIAYFFAPDATAGEGGSVPRASALEDHRVTLELLTAFYRLTRAQRTAILSLVKQLADPDGDDFDLAENGASPYAVP